MNKIYKVIWSKAKKCYVVVSEIAKHNGKCSSSLNKKIIASFLAAGLVTTLPMSVEAATFNDGTGVAVGADGTYSHEAVYYNNAWGDATYADGGNSTALGKLSSTLGYSFTRNNKPITIHYDPADGMFKAFDYAGKRFSSASTITGLVDRLMKEYPDSVKFTRIGGYSFTYNGKPMTIRYAYDGKFVAYDSAGTRKASADTLKKLEEKLIGFSWVQQTYTPLNATAFGSATVAAGTNATTFGERTFASSNNSTAFGARSQATANQATAFGFKTVASAENATAWGHETTASDKRATAFGIETTASGRNSTSFGHSTTASGENATAFGSGTIASGGGAASWGTDTQAKAETSTTWGNGSIVYAGRWNADGNLLYSDVEVLRDTSLPEGKQYYIVGINESTGDRETIPGQSEIATRAIADNLIREHGRIGGYNSTAFGMGSQTYAENSLAALGGKVGQDNSNDGLNSAAIGLESHVKSSNAYAMGRGATIGDNSNGSVALGGNGRLKFNNTEYSDLYVEKLSNTQYAVFGIQNDGTMTQLASFTSREKALTEIASQNQNHTAIEKGAVNSFAAIGGKIMDDASNAIAIGSGTKVEKSNSIAIGSGNTVTGNNSIAVGTGLTVSGDNSGAFGDPSEINSANSYSVGNENKIGTGYTDVFALGNHITRVESNSVFLGSNSGYVPADNPTTAGVSTYGSMTINDHVYPFAGGGNSVAGVVSVGNNVDGEITTRRIQNVAPGLISADSTDAINGSQLYQAMQALSIEVKGDPTDTRSTKVDVSNPPATETAPAAGGDTPGGTAGTTMEIKLTPATTYTVTASTTTAKAGSKNIKVLETIGPDNPKSYKYTIDLARDIEVDSVTAGNTVMNNDGVTIKNGPSMTKDGIDAGGKKITNVAPGENDTDAVNVSQLRDYAAGNSQAINTVDSRARKGVAGAAALAALHPLDFDPDDKLTFAAGMANFRGETAAAIGAFYRPDEKVMFSVGGTFGNGENLVNAGVSFSLDRTPRVTGSRTALTKEVVALREHVARQDAQIAELTALVRQLAGNAGVNMPAASSLPTAMPAMFPDNLDNKWAYDSIEELQQKGYITGYAGRTLTREEFAAALDMAMKRGATLEERLVKAFEPELSHVRVAHVEGNGNEDGKWYERPRFSYDKLEKKHEIEKKNARIVPAKQK